MWLSGVLLPAAQLSPTSSSLRSCSAKTSKELLSRKPSCCNVGSHIPCTPSTPICTSKHRKFGEGQFVLEMCDCMCGCKECPAACLTPHETAMHECRIMSQQLINCCFGWSESIVGSQLCLWFCISQYIPVLTEECAIAWSTPAQTQESGPQKKKNLSNVVSTCCNQN